MNKPISEWNRGQWESPHLFSIVKSPTFKGMWRASVYGSGWSSHKNFDRKENAILWAKSQKVYIPSYDEVTHGGKYGTD